MVYTVRTKAGIESGNLMTNNNIVDNNQAEFGSKEEQDILDSIPRIDAGQKAAILDSLRKRLQEPKAD